MVYHGIYGSHGLPVSIFIRDALIVISVLYFSSGMVVLHVSMLNQTPKNIEYYIT